MHRALKADSILPLSRVSVTTRVFLFIWIEWFTSELNYIELATSSSISTEQSECRYSITVQLAMFTSCWQYQQQLVAICMRKTSTSCCISSGTAGCISNHYVCIISSTGSRDRSSDMYSGLTRPASSISVLQRLQQLQITWHDNCTVQITAFDSFTL